MKIIQTSDNAGLDEVIFGLGIGADEVHAPLAAVVASVQPVFLLSGGARVLPREEVALAAKALVNFACETSPEFPFNCTNKLMKIRLTLGAEGRHRGLQDAPLLGLGNHADGGQRHQT